VATSPLTNFGVSSQLPPETPALRLAELVRLRKFAQRITSTLDIEELVPRIVDEVAASLGCVEINLYLRDPEHSELVLTGVCGCSMYGKGHRLQVGSGMVGHVAATGKMHYAPDVALDPYYVACEPDTRSEVAIPLQREGDLVGVFTASSTLSAPTNCGCCKACALMLLSRYTTPSALAMNANSASA